MTPDLYQRWIQGQHPFDGMTLSIASDDLVPLPALLHVLRLLVEELERMYGDRPLHTAPDWHERDGCIIKARPSSWDELRSWLVSRDALMAAGHGDTYVRTAILPEDAEFYLRFYVPWECDNHYPERRGDFDLTAEAEVVQSLAALLENQTVLPLALDPAKQFFDGSYSG